MNRLLQGDVGSGKTVVAAACAYFAWQNGCQAALMAPTELLAQQHQRTMETLLAGTRPSGGASGGLHDRRPEGETAGRPWPRGAGPDCGNPCAAQ